MESGEFFMARTDGWNRLIRLEIRNDRRSAAVNTRIQYDANLLDVQRSHCHQQGQHRKSPINAREASQGDSSRISLPSALK
jgi:hypothetical protein